MDWLPAITDTENWRVIGVKTLRQQQRRTPIAPQEFPLAGAIALVEASYSNAPETWNFAGWANGVISLPGSRVLVKTFSLSLRESVLIVLPKVEGQYLLQLTFPRWLPQIRLIVRDYIGDDFRPADQLDRIEQRLDLMG